MVTTITYGQKTVWESRDDAIAFFIDAMRCCEGSERDRYTNVYLDLIDGQDVCRDEQQNMTGNKEEKK